MVSNETTIGKPTPGRVAGGSSGSAGNEGPRRGPLPDGEIEYEASFSKSRILTWFLLLVVVMTFGGVIGAYVVISTNGVLEWRPFALPFQVWISTLIILASSVTYYFAERSVRSADQRSSKKWLAVTTALGATFVSSQVLAWWALVQRGVYLQSNPYAGFFYILTALHAIHVAGGIIALGYLVLMVWERERFDAGIDRIRDVASAVGWYWHFMGVLWIVLFILLGFWK